MDKILLSGLRIECIVGVWAWERQVRQTVVLDIEMAVDVRKAAASDRIEDATDYKKVTDAVTTFVGGSQFNLVETLAENTAQLLLREFNVGWVRLVVSKPGALKGVNVRIAIERSA